MAHDMPLVWWQHASAVALIAVIGVSMWRGRRRKATLATPEAITSSLGETTGEDAVTLRISGMTCEHCTETVARGLRNAPGVTSAEVDLASGRATVRGENLDVATLRQVVRDLGYDVPA
jgi:copper chaperone CopZ